jgi:hypothetical protein
MRSGNRDNKGNAKEIARKNYAIRQIDRFTKWSIENKGYIKYKDIVDLHNKYNINIY